MNRQLRKRLNCSEWASMRSKGAYHFLNQTNELHQPAPQLSHLLVHLRHMLLVDLSQGFERMTSVLWRGGDKQVPV